MPNVYSKRLDEFVASFNMYAVHFGINSPLRIAMYLAQVFHESANLRYVEELASGAAYDTGHLAAQLGNTPEKDGDGQKYKGRGYLQLTGLNNYKAFKKSEWCTVDVVADPKKVADYPLNQVSAMWFWETHNLNKWADEGNVEKVTKIINGGQNGLANRKYLYRMFCKEFGIKKI